jgi:xyloglucan fucosyltransferase
VFTENGIAPVGLQRNMGKGTQNPGSLESGLVDMVLLSLCDDLVVTFASSFGAIAAAWGGRAPVHMLFGAHHTSQVRPAAASISSATPLNVINTANI